MSQCFHVMLIFIYSIKLFEPDSFVCGWLGDTGVVVIMMIMLNLTKILEETDQRNVQLSIKCQTKTPTDSCLRDLL